MTTAPERATTLTLYTTSSCGFCQRLKTQLERAGIGYAEVDIETDPAAARYVENVNGGNQVVPTVVCPNGTVLTNPGIADIQRCLTDT